jgi:1,4-dihydroxy-2-naphthoate octaprenyltransferase
VSSRRRHVDPIRVHLITVAVFGVIAGAALALWTFPRFFGVLALLAVSVFV